MQNITIGVGRTRDMRTVRVYVQFRDSARNATLVSKAVGGVTYHAPFELTREQAIVLGDLVYEQIKALLKQPELPF
jgi:hypothetical protein